VLASAISLLFLVAWFYTVCYVALFVERCGGRIFILNGVFGAGCSINWVFRIMKNSSNILLYVVPYIRCVFACF
jgi:hypothetical protein